MVAQLILLMTPRAARRRRRFQTSTRACNQAFSSATSRGRIKVSLKDEVGAGARIAYVYGWQECGSSELVPSRDSPAEESGARLR